MYGLFLRILLRRYCIILSLTIVFLYPIYPCFGSTSQQDMERDLINGAKGEGTLVIYHSATIQDMTDVFNGFKKKYPFLNIRGYRSGSDSIVNKIEMETRAGKNNWDVVEQRGEYILPLKQKKLLLKFVSPESSMIPDALKDPEGYWTAWKTVTQVVGYNTRLVKKEDIPRSLSGFLAPEWKGKIAMDDRSGEWYAAVMKYLGPEEGLRVMKGLAQQNIIFRKGRSLLAQLLSAGEHPIFIGASGYRMEQLKEMKAPVDWADIDPVVQILDVLSISSHSPHPNAARLFVNFGLSEEGQQIITKVGRDPARKGVMGRFRRITEGKKFPLDPNLDISQSDAQFRKIFLQ